MREILTYVQRDYVDTVNVKALSREAIDGMLEKLDPHSAYVPAEDLEMANASLVSDFDGIGVEFLIIKDSVEIVSPLSGGPSDRAGVRPGDRILKVNGYPLVGEGVNNELVFKRLRGPRNSQVQVELLRPLTGKILNISIRRDRIPTRSVDAGLMMEPGLGYIKLSTFSESTYEEFHKALKSLKKQGMTRLVLDLRDNPGGYMDKAVKIADEFIADKKLIVYTDGKDPKYDNRYTANRKGDFEQGPLTVLLNEGSASAAEILAGALQDHDRATIVGRRSFGKGLVQLPIPLADGGELRLTISRYFTPSGRCIQKAYDADHAQEYDEDLSRRFSSGEAFFEDSIHNVDTVRYKTNAGRIVYGGGGIRPDVFVPLDTVRHSLLLGQLYAEYIPQTIASRYAEQNRDQLKTMGLKRFKYEFKITPAMMEQVLVRTRREKIKFTNRQWQNTRETVAQSIKATIARTAYGDNGYYAIMLEGDDDYQRAIHKGWKIAMK